MPDKKHRTHKKHTVAIWLLFIILIIIASPSFAEVKVFEREYTYQASEVDSKLSSRTISLTRIDTPLSLERCYDCLLCGNEHEGDTAGKDGK